MQPSSARTAEPAQTTAAAPAADAPIPVRYRVDVRTTIKKLHSDLVAGPGTLDGSFVITAGGGSFRVDITGTLTLPPSRGYFVSFGFVPVTATVTLTPSDKVTAVLLDGKLTTTIKLGMRLSEVKVNGTPLDVGTHCESAQPLEITQSGAFSSPLTSGSIAGSYTIPPFHGCGATEDLDPLFTGLVSGPGNSVKTTLTFVCGGPTGCPQKQ
ncbi:hypothetical protein BC739_002051 [Kutzneria viridogrisea]|uniref:Uncharacterized protein n=1 Tax=Kutzneria viridogrisea TaxID=47990 RepID=A0ABR6BDC8_9PSEU|nr:hypothetical protein [Kutzneria albida]MBA8924852.1 hypothetical protein [Kutzneria viridogrisea]